MIIQHPVMQFSGIVVDGDKRGKDLGFPTANLKVTVPEDCWPEHGLYSSMILIGKKFHESMTTVGPAKTFKKTDPKIETNIFDFDSDIYGQTVILVLYEKIRPIIDFGSPQALSAQFVKDREKIRKRFAYLRQVQDNTKERLLKSL